MANFMCVAVLVVVSCFGLSEAGQCCKSYRDLGGTYHHAQWCDNYCCNNILTWINKGCCDDPSMAQASNVDEECTSWIKQHIWVPIVIAVVFLMIIGCVTCCCCCGFCCCRKDRTVVIHSPSSGPMASVQMSTTNQLHAGYNQ